MKLEDIGFYTLFDARARDSSATSPMQRCEMILTYKCNFKCAYCRGPKEGYGEDTAPEQALETLKYWCDDGLRNVRFSGGEPLSYSALEMVVAYAAISDVERIAVSTNGSFPLQCYLKLFDLGVNDFSISLDACCAADGDQIAGVAGSWKRVASNIRELSKLTYVTVGIVLTESNISRTLEIIETAHDLGVADIRLITAAQYNRESLRFLRLVRQEVLEAHPILKYRVNNLLKGRNVRGLQETDNNRCPLLFDDSVVHGKYHYPCVIYLREHGKAIGEVGPSMRAERVKWATEHDTFADEICRKNCLDVCIDYNNKTKVLRIGANQEGVS